MNEGHLCCGSAGTYSVLQPELSGQLRDRKLLNLAELKPSAIVSANVGCINHLQSGTDTPVKHWVEALDEALAEAVRSVDPSPTRYPPVSPWHAPGCAHRHLDLAQGGGG
jgi:hypothetical protein